MEYWHVCEPDGSGRHECQWRTATSNPASTPAQNLPLAPAACHDGDRIPSHPDLRQLNKDSTGHRYGRPASIPAWEDLISARRHCRCEAPAFARTLTRDRLRPIRLGTADGFNCLTISLARAPAPIVRALAPPRRAASPWGLMIRETLSPDSANAYALFGGGNDPNFLHRTSTHRLAATVSLGHTDQVTHALLDQLLRQGSVFPLCFSVWRLVKRPSRGLQPDHYAWPRTSSSACHQQQRNTRLTTATFDQRSGCEADASASAHTYHTDGGAVVRPRRFS